MVEPALAPGDLLTVPAALALVPVGRTLFYELIRDGQIPAVRVKATGSRRGRLLVHRDDLAAFVARAREGATPAPTAPDVDGIHARVRRNLARHPGVQHKPRGRCQPIEMHQNQGETECTT